MLCGSFINGFNPFDTVSEDIARPFVLLGIFLLLIGMLGHIKHIIKLLKG